MADTPVADPTPVSSELEDLARELLKIQTEKGWSDGEMAKEIGCETSTWRMVRLGERRAGRLVMDGALRRWPELQLVYARWLRETGATS